MKLRTACWFLLLLIASIGATDVEPLGDQHLLEGIVTDGEKKAVPWALVFASLAETGIPVTPSGVPFYEGRYNGDKFELAGDITDEEGQFKIELPERKYIIIAQKWVNPDHEWTSNLGQVNLIKKYGETVELHGYRRAVDYPTTGTLTVSAYASTAGTETSQFFDFPYAINKDIPLASPGTGKVRVKVESSNSATLLIASTSPPSLDPIFGFHAWEGDFLRNMIGFNRMPGGKTTFLNVPEGTLYLAAFANDNRPGFASGSVEVSPGETSSISMQFVAGWSDGRHIPPDPLIPLYTKFKTSSWKLKDINEMIEIMKEVASEKEVIHLLQNPEKANQLLTLPDNSQASFKDVFTVYKYLEKWPKG